MTFYLFGSGVYFAYLSFNNFNDRSAKTNLASWLVIVVASAFWVLVIPISLIEIRMKAYAMGIEEIEELITSEVNSQGTESVQEFDSDTQVRLTTENT